MFASSKFVFGDTEYDMMMKSASVLAQQYGLEEYLNKPDELNKAILRLMLLQETIQLEQARKKKRENPDQPAISCKRIASGKLIAECIGDVKYRYAVETSLKASTTLVSLFHRSRFISVLRSMGVPEEKINEYCSSIVIDDNTYCIDQD
jgi:hypothetical protein